MIVGPCTIVSGGPEPQVFEQGAVRVVGAHIASVGALGDLAAAHPEETLWPARGRVLMPGLVNSHAHLARHLARGLSLRTSAEWRRYDRGLSAEDVSWAAQAALIEGLRHGVTTVVDFHRSGACLDLSLSEVTAAAERVGVRVATCYGAAEDDTPLERRAAIDECVGFARDLARQRSGRLRGMLGVQATSLRGIETLLAEAMESAGGGLAVHVDLALDLTPAERWSRADALPGTALPALWAHAERAPRGLLGTVRERGDTLCATGCGSVAALVRENEVAWGSDDGVNAPPLPDGPHGPALGEALYRRLFVIGSAWASEHFGVELGRIRAGAPADFILLDYRAATELSTRTLGAHLWAGLLRAPVAGVMVAGQVLVDNGVVVGVDEGEVAARARECAARVWGRLG
ncbi:MAG TPA: amidohydrolase family protein [Candidatus Acidoferrales bacterium]|nr:amidohydrolase family protein [Candidatus Acidoferrales bacterium]